MLSQIPPSPTASRSQPGGRPGQERLSSKAHRARSRSEPFTGLAARDAHGLKVCAASVARVYRPAYQLAMRPSGRIASRAQMTSCLNGYLAAAFSSISIPSPGASGTSHAPFFSDSG